MINYKNIKGFLLQNEILFAENELNSLSNQYDKIAIVKELVVPLLDEAGKEWEQGLLSLSQVYMMGKFFDGWFSLNLVDETFVGQSSAKLALAVFEDHHTLGKKIVKSVLNATGYFHQDYENKNSEQLIALVIKDEIEIIMLSSLMLHSALRISNFTNELQKKNLPTKVLVGGAPFRFDDHLWVEVGADGTSADAAGVIPLIERFSISRGQK